MSCGDCGAPVAGTDDDPLVAHCGPYGAAHVVCAPCHRTRDGVDRAAVIMVAQHFRAMRLQAALPL